ncbi:MAG TPA: hypothetical protein VKR58_11190, partial [Aquella sp.]|nr:hypothetical protein [Aquella sp.]
IDDIAAHLNGPLQRQLEYDEIYTGGFHILSDGIEMYFTATNTGISTLSAIWISPNIKKDEEGNIISDQTEVIRDFEKVILDYLNENVPQFKKGSLKIDYKPECIQISFKTVDLYGPFITSSFRIVPVY